MFNLKMPRVCADLQWAASFAPGGGSRSAIFGQVSWSLRCSMLHFPHRRVSWHLHMEKHLLLISLNNIWVAGCSTEKSNSCDSSHLKAAHLCKTLVDRSWISGEKTRKRCIFFLKCLQNWWTGTFLSLTALYYVTHARIWSFISPEVHFL